MTELEQLEEQERFLVNQLAILPQEKWDIAKYIVGGTILPFVFPLFMSRSIDSTIWENYIHAVVVFAIGSIIITTAACYIHIRKVNYEIYSTKYDLKAVRQKINILK